MANDPSSTMKQSPERLAQEVERIRFEKEVLIQQVEDLQKAISANAHVREARNQLADAKTRFDQMCRNLIREVTEVKTLHPIQVLLQAKRAELDRVRAARKRLPNGHPEARQFDQIIRDHEGEMAQLQEMVSQAEQVIQYQLERLEEVAQHAAQAQIDPASAVSTSAVDPVTRTR